MRVAPPNGQDAAPLSLVGRHYAPEIAEAAMTFSRATYSHSKLSLREFEAARIMTARLNGCALCRDWRTAVDLAPYLKSLGHDGELALLSAGQAPDEDFYEDILNWRGAPHYSPRERIAIELAERMGAQPQTIAKDERFWRQAKAVFSDAELIDLGYCIACWMGLGRMTHVFGLDGACALPADETPIQASYSKPQGISSARNSIAART